MKLIVWIAFIAGVIGYWCFHQYLLIDVLAQYGCTKLSIICILIVLSLLPYSLANRLKIPKEWYSIAFCPSIGLMTILAQENIGLVTIVSVIVLLALWVGIIIRKPKLKCNPFTSNLCIIAILLIYSMSFSNTNELAHYKYKIKHLIENKQYDEALNVGKKSLSINEEIFQLRAEAMAKTNSLGDQIFRYPIPYTKKLAIKLKNCEAIKNNRETIDDIHEQNNFDSTQNNNKDVLLCNLLLEKKLPEFARLLQKFYNIDDSSLPQYYKEALTVLLSRSLNTEIKFSDSTTLANYQDFLAEMKKHTDTIVSNNQCRNLYGDTYFWYYFFFPIKQ